MSRTSTLVLLAIFTLALHLPFLKQQPQADEVNYLDMAAHVFAQPLTPLNFSYVFQGQRVHMGGHPHPPLNAYLLAALWAVFGRFSPFLFHTAYLVFALGISWAAYEIAAGRTSRPLFVALLLASAPVVQVAGNSLETDGPALALALGGAACFMVRRFLWAGLLLALGGMTALQALAIPPILLLDYALRREKPPRSAYAAAAAPFAALAGWQLLQWAATQRLPVAQLFGYATGSAFGRLRLKLDNALALISHLGILLIALPLRPKKWALLPGVFLGALVASQVSGYAWWERGFLILAFALGIQTLVWMGSQTTIHNWWGLLYFGFCLVAFFAGAARYLLPLAFPLILLFVREYEKRPRILAAALALNIILGLNLSWANYDLGRIYSNLRAPGPPFLVNGELGFRYRMTRLGGEMLEAGSVPQPGEWMVSSELCLGGHYGSLAEAVAVPLDTRDLFATTPFRLFDRYARSGYYSASFGLLPFSFSKRPLDTITYARTSPYWKLPARWLPTQLSGHLVYLPASEAEIRLPIEPPATRLHFSLFFTHGTGEIHFVALDPAGQKIYDRVIERDSQLWMPQDVLVRGLPEVVLKISYPPGRRAGWAELAAY